MIEHRLIERMLALLQNALEEVEITRIIDPLFVDKAVDFIRTYADRTHHGKEEDILFRDLNNKALSDADRKIMAELIEEHLYGRDITRALAEANALYQQNGNSAALADIARCLRTLVEFYPKHIAKEDKVFFPASRAYFSEEEDQAMLAEFMDFDRRMIHEKYKSLIDELTLPVGQG
jgi:hemerythrin-like domain-containing protein